ncbi:L,D-transpeptidase-like protein [Marichromatium gracile]|uniref:L,D-transpeptidase-like protein n=1 Tax=Marichromatium gracile TaxID=1048 RepID=A0A4R4ABN2_MARGR|nr:L,D-transpeptidase-like protein [Marichromatium gracile]
MMSNPTPTLRTLARPRTLWLCALALTTLSGCTEWPRLAAKPEPQPAPPEPAEQQPPQPQSTPVIPKEPSLYEWRGEGRRVSHIVVDTDDQKARFYDGDVEVGWATVATGVSRHPTPTGSFTVMEKVENKRSNLYGRYYGSGGKLIQSNVKVGRDPLPDGARFVGAKMPYFMRLTYDGIGLHAGPIPRPGRPASHGCIRMPAEVAPLLFAKVDQGTAVTIVGRGPSYGNYAKRQRQLAAERAASARREQAARAQSAPEPSPPQPAPITTTTPRVTDTTAPTPLAPAQQQPDQPTAPDDAPATVADTPQTVARDEPAPATVQDIRQPLGSSALRLPESGMVQRLSPEPTTPTPEANEG